MRNVRLTSIAVQAAAHAAKHGDQDFAFAFRMLVDCMHDDDFMIMHSAFPRTWLFATSEHEVWFWLRIYALTRTSWDPTLFDGPIMGNEG